MTDAVKTMIFERTYAHPAEKLWQLWTTKAGIESWWGPEGFTVTVNSIDLSVGGGVDYAMTATGAEQIEFMKQANAPLSTETHVTFTEIDPPHRLAYSTLTDFIPDVVPYDHNTLVEITPIGDGVHLTITVDVMHNELWTERSRMGEEMQLVKLDTLLNP